MAFRLTLAGIGACALLFACSGSTPAAQATPDAPQQAPTASGPPPPPADPLAVGSQAAKDDMYCSALIYYENPDVSDALAPVDEALLRKAQTLGFIIGEAGINKLVEEKAIHATHARVVAEAYAGQVAKDGDKPRIPLDECNKRAAAVPIPE
jgi:hypothetical protein